MDVKFNERMADEAIAKMNNIKMENILEQFLNTNKDMRFGDIVINHSASEDNPIRIGVFLKRSGKNFNMTDCRGAFWQSGPQAKLEVVGSVLKYPADPFYALDVQKYRSTHS
jgi:hypothetical protein